MIHNLASFAPHFIMVIFALSFTMQIWNRSITTFVSTVTATLVLMFHHYSLFDLSSISIMIGLSIIFIRAMLKPNNDTFKVKGHHYESV